MKNINKLVFEYYRFINCYGPIGINVIIKIFVSNKKYGTNRQEMKVDNMIFNKVNNKCIGLITTKYYPHMDLFNVPLVT